MDADNLTDPLAYLRARAAAILPEVAPVPETKVVSDGSSTDYYKLPADATDLIDLIEHKNMSFGIGNIFKACYRLGEKAGTDAAYDLRKIIFFAERALKQIEKQNG